MKTERVLSYIEKHYGIKTDRYQVIPRLMFRESLEIYWKRHHYVVKKYPVSTPPTRLADMVELYEELARCGVVTNQVVRSTRNDPFFEMPDGKYIIFTFVPGIPINAEMVKQETFQAISKVHVKMGHIQLEKAGLQNGCTDSRLESCYDWSEIDGLTERINESVDLLKKIDEDYQRVFENRRKIVIHGDCTLNNIVFLGREFYLIDFDNYRLGFPEDDFANLLNSILYSTADSEEKIGALMSAHRYFCYADNNRDLIQTLKLCMQKNASRELYKHRENYRYLRRTPGTVQYLHELLDIIINIDKKTLAL